MTRPRFRLLTTIGRSYAVDTDDVLRTKTVLSRLGYLDTPAMSITRYPDEPMFRGIEEFQDDFDLLPDGVIKPSGETAGKLNEVLEFRHREILTGRQQDAGAVRRRRSAMPPNSSSGSLAGERKPGSDRTQLAAAPLAIPLIVYEIALWLGISVTAAFSWWASLPAEEKKRVRTKLHQSVDGHGVEQSRDDACEELLQIDSATCAQVGRRRGKRAAARCWATAQERYAACLKGTPKEFWPPLDVWNN